MRRCFQHTYLFTFILCSDIIFFKTKHFFTISSTLLFLQDQDVMHSWLLDLHFEEYFPLFMASGYDMPTITKMTPEVCKFFFYFSFINRIHSLFFFTMCFLVCIVYLRWNLFDDVIKFWPFLYVRFRIWQPLVSKNLIIVKG